MNNSENYHFKTFKSKKEKSKDIPISEGIKVFPLEKYEAEINTEKGAQLIKDLINFQRILDDKNRSRHNYPSALQSRLLDFYLRDVVSQEEVDTQMSLKEWKGAKKDKDEKLPLELSLNVQEYRKQLEENDIILPDEEWWKKIDKKFREVADSKIDSRHGGSSLVDWFYGKGEKPSFLEQKSIEDILNYQKKVLDRNIPDADLLKERKKIGRPLSLSLENALRGQERIKKNDIEKKKAWSFSNMIKRDYGSSKKEIDYIDNIDRGAEEKAIEEVLRTLHSSKKLYEHWEEFEMKRRVGLKEPTEEDRFEKENKELKNFTWKKTFVDPYEERVKKFKKKSDGFKEMEQWIKYFKQSEIINKELENNYEKNVAELGEGNILPETKKPSEPELWYNK